MSTRPEDVLDFALREIGWVSGQLAAMLVRRRLGRNVLEIAPEKLRKVADELEKLNA